MSRRARVDRLLGDPRLRTITAIALVVVVVFGIAFHLPPSLVVVLVLAVLALAVVVRLIGSADLEWPPRQSEGSSHGWVGVAMLSHGIAVSDSSPWEFDRVIRPRLSRLAAAALIREGVEWDSPRAREILGGPVHDALRPETVEPDTVPPETVQPDAVQPDAGGPSSRTALAAATLEILDSLERAGAGTGAGPVDDDVPGADRREQTDVRTAT